MQFQTTVFQNEKQIVDGKPFSVLVIEQHLTVICDKCNFSLTGTKDEIDQSDFLLIDDELTLCGECSY